MAREIEKLDMYILPECKVHYHSFTVVQLSLSQTHTMHIMHAHLYMYMHSPRSVLQNVPTYYVHTTIPPELGVHLLSFPERPLLP